MAIARKKKIINGFLLVITVVWLPIVISSQKASFEIIENSIRYHDPDGILSDKAIKLALSESRPGGSDRKSNVVLNSKKEYFKITREVDGIQTEMQLKGHKSSFKLNGSSKISNEDLKTHNLNADRLATMKNYYRYLWLLPGVLKDPGTIINPEYEVKDFFGKTLIEIKVTYDPVVGGDIWYFYFHPQTFALEGYRFYHDEMANDGEYILLSGIANDESVRLPKVRKWYTHKEGKLLGTDTLIELEID